MHSTQRRTETDRQIEMYIYLFEYIKTQRRSHIETQRNRDAEGHRPTDRQIDKYIRFFECIKTERRSHIRDTEA